MSEECPASPPQVGTVLDGQYRLDGLLGSGGIGAVYRAWHLGLQRPVAVKLLHGNFNQDREALTRFQLEAKLLGGLGHPSFVSVFDFGFTEDGLPYLVMELLDGKTLRQRLSDGGPLPIGEVLSLFQPLCEAMERAHQLGVLHRDLKPENLMLLSPPRGGVKILDFGVAKVIGDAQKAAAATAAITGAGMVAGSPNYMAPERARGRRDIDARSDLFALGAILYECLAGRLAFPGTSPMDIMRRIIALPVPALRLDDRELAARLDDVIATACAKDPRDRYGSSLELWRALEAAASRPGAAEEPSAVEAGAAAGQGPGAVKAALPRAVLDFVRAQFGEAALQRLAATFGAERAARIEDQLPGSFVELTELQGLLGAFTQLFDDGSLDAARRAGRHFAEGSLRTLYRSLLTSGSPATVGRRSPLAFRLLFSAMEATATQVGPDRFILRLREPSLSPGLLALCAGWIRGYLELSGVTVRELSDRLTFQGGQAVGEITFALAAAP